ncbi:MAG: acetylxylan esterase [Kiritimatiellia bacterium]|nr:acetylxylan esterase [Kiritimatiellia bacterium]
MNRTFQSLLRYAFAYVPAGLKRVVRREWEKYFVRARHQAARRQLVCAAEEMSAHCLSSGTTQADWTEQCRMERTQLRTMLGLEPLPSRTNLQARITGTTEHSGYRMERIVFESAPGLCVTANFYRPANCHAPVPCILYLCGHLPLLDGAKVGYQDRYLWYPANGFALLVVDPLGFGEIPGVHPGTQRLNQWNWLSRGYTPAGVEVWNAMRALDWLATRPEVDSSRIGVTGISGGGVMAQYLAALDDRVTAVAASCSTFTFGNQAARGLVQRQCDCTFYPNVFGLDFPEVLALIAPRPLLILGGRRDPIFPPSGFRAAFRRAQTIYDMLREGHEAEPRIRLIESGEGHTDPPQFLGETRRWMCRWLGVRASSLPGKPSPLPEHPAALRCLTQTPIAAVNDHVQDMWIPRPILDVPQSSTAWKYRRAHLQDVLRMRIFRWFPPAQIPFRTRPVMAKGGYAGTFADYQEYEYTTEGVARVRVRLLMPKGKSAPAPVVIWIKRPKELVDFPDIDEFHSLLHTHVVAILTPRLVEKAMTAREHAEIERMAALTGRSILSLHVWDVLRTIQWLKCDREIFASSVSVIGAGSAGLAGLYAAVLYPAIDHVLLRAPPSSHEEGPPLPTILRDTDINEVAGMVAPRRLSLLACRPEEFAVTRSIFEVVGAANAFGHFPSVSSALRAMLPEGATAEPC